MTKEFRRLALFVVAAVAPALQADQLNAHRRRVDGTYVGGEPHVGHEPGVGRERTTCVTYCVR